MRKFTGGQKLANRSQLFLDQSYQIWGECMWVPVNLIDSFFPIVDIMFRRRDTFGQS